MEPSAAVGSEASIDPLEGPEQIAPAELARWSRYFGPFLRHFLDENRATGGSVLAARRPSGVDGVMLVRDVERLASIFARDEATARQLASARGRRGVFAEWSLAPDAVPYPVYDLRSPLEREDHRFRHRIRARRPSDREAIAALLHQVWGPVDARWLAPADRPREHGLVAEVDGRVVGVAWLTVVGTDGRLHSLTVAPRYRGIGVGHDLVRARLALARSAGVHRVVTEIAATNGSSTRIATAAGFRPIGAVYEHPPPRDAA